MLYNKHNVRKINDKKILHKIGKHWVAVSIAMLAMIGGGAAATTGVANHVATPVVGTAEVHAAATNNNFQESAAPQNNSATMEVSNGINGNMANNASQFSNLSSGATVNFTNNYTSNEFAQNFGFHNATGSANNVANIDVTNLRNSNATDMTGTFDNDPNLVTFTNNTDANSNNAFFSGVSDTAGMFETDGSLQNVSLGTNALNSASSEDAMFANDDALTSVDLTNTGMGTAANGEYYRMFANDHNLQNVSLANNALNNATDFYGTQSMFAYDTALTNFTVNGNNHASNLADMFNGAENLSNVDLGNDVGNTASMILNGAFKDTALTNTNDVKGLNLKAASAANGMFMNDANLSGANLDLSSDGYNTDLGSVFANDPSLTNASLELNSSAATALASKASDTFINDNSLAVLNISAANATKFSNSTAPILSDAVLANGVSAGADVNLGVANSVSSGDHTYDLASAVPIYALTPNGAQVAWNNNTNNVNVPVTDSTGSTPNTKAMLNQGLTVHDLMYNQSKNSDPYYIWSNYTTSALNGNDKSQYHVVPGTKTVLGTVNGKAALIITVNGGQSVNSFVNANASINVPIKESIEDSNGVVKQDVNGGNDYINASQTLSPQFLDSLHLKVNQPTKIDLSKLIPSGYRLDTNNTNDNISVPYVYLTMRPGAASQGDPFDGGYSGNVTAPGQNVQNGYLNANWQISTDSAAKNVIAESEYLDPAFGGINTSESLKGAREASDNADPGDFVDISVIPSNVTPARNTVATMTNVTDAANSDPALRNALNAFTSNRSQDNGNDVINAIANNSGLKNDDLSLVDNDIKSLENGTVKHDATKSDVENAAKTDSALKDAMNEFKNNPTQANGHALANAIENDDTLKNFNLGNVINAIKGAEKNPSNHGNLDNLLKLYNLYMGLVNSGLFNN